MKAFYTAVTLFFIAVIVVSLNFRFINNLADTLTEMTNELPSPDEQGCIEAVQSLREFWEEKHDIACYSVNYIELNRISDYITSLCVFAETKNTEDFENTRALLINEFKELRRGESLSLHCIL